MRELPLSSGKTALVDDEDFEWADQWKWSYSPVGYALRQRREDKKFVYLHRELMDRIDGGQPGHVDHIDVNRLNNVRSNLRRASRSGNQSNRPKPKTGENRFKGVCWDKRRGRWRAYVTVKGKQHSVGFFVDELEAVRARDELAEKLHGEFFRASVIFSLTTPRDLKHRLFAGTSDLWWTPKAPTKYVARGFRT